MAATPGSVPAEFSGKTNPLGQRLLPPARSCSTTTALRVMGLKDMEMAPPAHRLTLVPKNPPGSSAVAADDYLFWRVSTGKEGTSMVAWKGILTDEEIWQAIAYIRTLK